MSPTSVSTDKLIFQELQFTLSGTKHFAWYTSEAAIASQVANGAENVGPRWSLWSETAEGRIPIYRYVRTASSSPALYDHAFSTMNDWTGQGYTLDNGGQPIGYATTPARAQADTLPMLQCSGSDMRYAYTQWQWEMDAYVSQNGMTQQPATWNSPMMCQVESTFDSSTNGVNLVSNDPDATKAAEGEVNVYRGKGTAIRFVNMGSGEYGANAIAVTYDGGPKNGQNAIGAGEAFQLAAVSFPNSIWLTTDDEQTTADQQFKYSVSVLVEGVTYTHDPKIIQRKSQFVD